jgi:ribosome-associated protein
MLREEDPKSRAGGGRHGAAGTFEERDAEIESPPASGLAVQEGFVIPWSELEIRASRSGGPGGQNVNKVATKVEVRWDVAGSSALDDATRARLLAALGARLDRGGRLRVTSQRHRTQGANRKTALERLAALVREALAPRRVRRATRPSRESRERRLQEKRRASARKRDRRGAAGDE